jgi:hypothetical protein
MCRLSHSVMRVYARRRTSARRLEVSSTSLVAAVSSAVYLAEPMLLLGEPTLPITLLGDSTVPILVEGGPTLPIALAGCGTSAVAGPVAGLLVALAWGLGAVAGGGDIVAGGRERAPAVPALLLGAPAVPALLLGAPAVPALLAALGIGGPIVGSVPTAGFIVGAPPTGAVGATPVAAPDGPGADAVAPPAVPAALASVHAPAINESCDWRKYLIHVCLQKCPARRDG